MKIGFSALKPRLTSVYARLKAYQTDRSLSTILPYMTHPLVYPAVAVLQRPTCPTAPAWTSPQLPHRPPPIWHACSQFQWQIAPPTARYTRSVAGPSTTYVVCSADTTRYSAPLIDKLRVHTHLSSTPLSLCKHPGFLPASRHASRS